MPQKSRRNKAKQKTHIRAKVSVVSESGQQHTLPSSPRQTAVTSSRVIEPQERYRYAVADAKRSLIIGVSLIILLVVLRLLLG